MPSKLVKTEKDGKLWEKAKQIASDNGQEENWAYIMGVYKKMNPDKFKNASLSLRVAFRWIIEKT
jgi:hypothetical protein